MDKPNVAVVSFSVFPEDGGPYKSVRLFAKALKAKVFSFSTGAEKSSAEQDDQSIVHFDVRGHHYYGSRVQTQLDRHMQGISLISSHKIFRWSNIAVRRVARRRKIPYWVVPHGSMDPWVFSYGRLIKRVWWFVVGRRYFASAAAIICATERERDKLSLRYHGQNCEVVYWPVDVLNVESKQDARNRLRAKLGISADDKLLIYLGRYHSMKRPLDVLKRFSQAEIQSTHLLFVGIDGDITADDIRRHVQIEGIQNVHVQGAAFGEEKNDLLLGADGYVSFSCRENFNHSAAEALAAGLPVILSHGNDLGGSLVDVGCGWWLQRDTPGEEISVLREFDSLTAGDLSKMGERGRSWVRENLSFEEFEAKLARLLKRSIEASSKE